MELVLERWPSKILAAALAAASTAALSLELWKHVEAGRLAQEGTVEGLAQAQRLEPRNAELYWRMGRLELYSELGDPKAAVAALDEATQLDPHAGVYWADLAQARESVGDVPGAAEDLERARAAEPRTPMIQWRAMSFALRNNQPDQALELGRVLLAGAPPYTGRVLPQLEVVASLSTLIERVLPADQGAVDVLTARLCNQMDPKTASVLWSRVRATGLPPSGFYLRLFLDALIGHGDGELASRVWTDSIQHRWIAGDPEGMQAPLYNSDFRRPMLGFGFDWKVIPQQETSVWVSDEGPLPGEACLCTDFSDRARADFYHITHPVLVEPGGHYLLSAKMRVRHVATPSGAFLAVFGIPGLQATTEHVVGSTGWEEVSTEFVAGPETRLAQVVLSRPGVGPQEPPASGQVCVAGVAWKRLNAAGPKGEPAAGRKVAR
jgi:hypothetical protein